MSRTQSGACHSTQRNMTPLLVRKEARVIEAIIRRAGDGGDYRVVVHPSIRTRDVYRAVLKHRPADLLSGNRAARADTPSQACLDVRDALIEIVRQVHRVPASQEGSS